MSKIFRLHKGTTQNIEDWKQLPGYLDHNSIDTINDPAGLDSENQITSIPTPFARFDLIKTAFRYVSSIKELDGTTIYHRLISDCLDIGQIFHDLDSYRNNDDFEIIEWSSGIYINGNEIDIKAESDLGKLINSNNPKHKLLGNTIKTFLIQDKKHFNFTDLKHLYFLNYKKGREVLNIIGGTSPTTLFFSSSNDLDFVDINFGNDRAFDGNFAPLYKREKSFIKYLFALKESFPNFSERFKGFDDYLNLTFRILDSDLQNEIRSYTNLTYNSDVYTNINVDNSAQNYIEILGNRLKCLKNSIQADPNENDFIINTTKAQLNEIPCILPIEPFNDELQYPGGNWQKDWYKKVPKYTEVPLFKRRLPNRDTKEYPFLTISDLLEPYIIKVPYPIDKEKFFDGNYISNSDNLDHGFILPLKKIYFDYFSVKDLMSAHSDGKKVIEIKKMSGGVTVTLRIPIKNNKYIQISRQYLESVTQEKILKPDEIKNQGVIIQNQFTVSIYPFIKVPDSINPHSRFLLVDRDVQLNNIQNNYSAYFYKDMPTLQKIKTNKPQVRSKKENHKIGTEYYIIESNYDIIEINNSFSTGILIPKMKESSKSPKKFKFAIDFGTTNTHIEYKTDEGSSNPFDITISDIQVATLFVPNEKTDIALGNYVGSEDIVDIIKEEFIPFVIDKNTLYNFPQRTVINDSGSFKINEDTFALADFNIPFWYLKQEFQLNSVITSNLKWINFKDNKKNEKRTRGFLKQLMLMIRNKVLLNGGTLSETEIVWFYPSSMTKYRIDVLEKAWTEFYTRYFGDNNHLHKLSESFAPFYYYYNREGVKPHENPAVNIDIGGGTTDVVIYKSENPVLLTSFKFSANTIFGDGYGYTSNENGFILKYEPIIKQALSETSAKSLINIYDNIKKSSNNSLELIEFYFSLEQNKLIKDNQINISFSKLLSEDADLKLVFLFFYASIIYHIANLMKAKNIDLPQYVTFSGNGSKLIKIISGGRNNNILVEFTKVIFKDVYETSNNFDLEIRLFDDPKEITCKGGLECTNYEKFESLEKKIYEVLIGNDRKSTISNTPLTYQEIENDEIKNGVNQSVCEFIDKFSKYNSLFSFQENFGINSNNLNLYNSILKKNINNDLISGIKERLIDVDNPEKNISESLFFYPLKGIINKLAIKIYKDSI